MPRWILTDMLHFYDSLKVKSGKVPTVFVKIDKLELDSTLSQSWIEFWNWTETGGTAV